MFQLIAIAAFFILGIAFFAIGKDDFGIKRVKEVSNDTSSKENELANTESPANNESNKEKVVVNSKTSSVIESTDKTSD